MSKCTAWHNGSLSASIKSRQRIRNGSRWLRLGAAGRFVSLSLVELSG
jgi:hypothetical protein